jgi:class 3 adenylate cyclase
VNTDTEEIRKLAAIMFTDMVGYSALSQRDDKLDQISKIQILRKLKQLFGSRTIREVRFRVG